MADDSHSSRLKPYRMHRVYSLSNGESRFGWAEVDLEPQGDIGDISKLIQVRSYMSMMKYCSISSIAISRCNDVYIDHIIMGLTEICCFAPFAESVRL